MGDIHEPAAVALLVAVSSRYEAALDWAERRFVEQFGSLLLASERFDFSETDYYTATMGGNSKLSPAVSAWQVASSRPRSWPIHRAACCG